MPLRTDFATSRRISEDLTQRYGTAQIPGVSELQNEVEIAISTKYKVDAVTESATLRLCRANIKGTNGYNVKARSTAFNFDFATIGKTVSQASTLTNKSHSGWQADGSIDIIANVRFRDIMTMTAPTTFTSSLSVTASVSLTGGSGTRAFWMLVMPIDSLLTGSASVTNPGSDSSSRSVTITSSSLVVAVAYKFDGSTMTALPQAAWGVYTKEGQ